VEPSTFQGGLETLQELNLEENDIDSLDELTFRNLSNLRKLWLNNNKLRRIGANTFKGLTNLERLYLHGNRIELIDSNAFVDLSNLKKLLLWRNNLKRIDSKTFKGLTSLELLYINENQIEEIDSSAFDDLGNVKLLSLHDNKLRRLNAIGCFHALTNKVVLVEIYANRFPTKIVSFYKKQSAPIKWSQELPNIENDLAKNGGFLSDWSQFLLQFAKIDGNSIMLRSHIIKNIEK
jgi:Leucine-rich repeat (LRR) protein